MLEKEAQALFNRFIFAVSYYWPIYQPGQFMGLALLCTPSIASFVCLLFDAGQVSSVGLSELFSL